MGSDTLDSPESSTPLGRTGLRTGRLAISSGYGLPGDGVRHAFDRGQNFFHLSSRRHPGFVSAVADLAKSSRGEIAIAVHSYARLGWSLRRAVTKDLRILGVDRLDVLYLGYWQRIPFQRVVDAALKLKAEGRVRHLGVACHNRPLFVELHAMGVFDFFMVRYNAVHRGAEKEVFPFLPPREEGPVITTYTTTRWRDLVNPKKTPPGERTPTGADCVRFALSHPRVDAVFCAPKSVEEMKDSLGALAKGLLSEDEMTWMHRVGDHIHARYRKIFA